MPEHQVKAEVIAVYPDKVKISVDDIKSFSIPGEKLKVGSYLEISDDENHGMIAVIENFSIELKDVSVEGSEARDTKRFYIIEALPLGIVDNGRFERGGDTIAIPPTGVRPAAFETIKSIFESSVEDNKKFTFSCLAQNHAIRIPVDGNKFFNKHIAIVGSTGSGKSHTVARIAQNAVNAKDEGVEGLNNSHIVIFDIHSEYKNAFPEANIISIDDLALPYWLFNADELEELFLESGDFNNYNQASILRTTVVANKKYHNPDVDKIYFDSPLFFDIHEVSQCIKNISSEYIVGDSCIRIYVDGQTIEFENELDKICSYFETQHNFQKAKDSKKGPYADGTLLKFISRLETKINNDRLTFLFGDDAKLMHFENVLAKILGYVDEQNCNITIIDLSGVPFEVLSITVSLISRLLFEYGYYYKKINSNAETPLLLVYEEIHKYAPKSEMARYKSSQKAIETIAKEGRKYGVSLLIATQRPSEVSETIFSQCSNFIAMRLTNPDDQRYVKRLLPDTLGNLTDSLPALKAGEGILIGEAVVLPSMVLIDKCEPEPSSSDVPYLEEWKKAWKDVAFGDLTNNWNK